MGWALMGMADVLVLAPPSTEGRAELRDRFAAMVAALMPLQRDDGLWPVVVDRPESYAEPTLPAMFAIALRRADPAVPGTGAAVAAAVQAVRALTDAEGVLGRVSEATPVGQYSTYATRPFGQFPWGQGPLLMMECTA
jgi:unsaturated rhamnogalacturonyl hydrolase